MSLKIYIDGKLYDKENAKISVYDHGLLYGDGVFEGMRSYGGRVFRLAEHIDRLWDSAKAIWLRNPHDEGGNDQGRQRHAGRQRHQGRLRPPGGHARRRHAWARSEQVRQAQQSSSSPTTSRSTPRSCTRRGLEIVTVSVPRTHPAALSPRIKSLNYLNNILAKIEGHAGRLHRGPDAQPQGRNGRMHRRQHLPGRSGRFLTPPVDAGILEGITRNAVIELARESGIEVREVALTKYDAYVADEIFLDRLGGRGDSGGEARRPHDRRRQAGPDDPRS